MQINRSHADGYQKISQRGINNAPDSPSQANSNPPPNTKSNSETIDLDQLNKRVGTYGGTYLNLPKDEAESLERSLGATI